MWAQGTCFPSGIADDRGCEGFSDFVGTWGLQNSTEKDFLSFSIATKKMSRWIQMFRNQSKVATFWLPDRLPPSRANKTQGQSFVIASGLYACGFISFMQIGLSLPQMIFFPVVLHAGRPESWSHYLTDTQNHLFENIYCVVSEIASRQNCHQIAICMSSFLPADPAVKGTAGDCSWLPVEKAKGFLGRSISCCCCCFSVSYFGLCLVSKEALISSQYSLQRTLSLGGWED